VGASSLSRRALSHRGARTPDHKILTQLTRGRAGGWGRAVFGGATTFNGDLSSWNVRNVVDMDSSACGPASAVPNCPRVCTPADAPTDSHSLPAAAECCLGRWGVGASGLSRRALSHRGARPPDHKIVP
jgi:hypothetical protein